MVTSADDGVFESVKEEYLAPMLAEIRRDAEKEACGGELRSVHVFRAFEDRFAGRHRHRSLGSWLQDNIFLVLAVLMTVIFGAFGLFHPDDGDVAGFLDIAKIFAGAVVGGAAGSAGAAFARRRKDAKD
ncbi:MAG TPA: hypothetical protein VGB08_06355 [Allosphingosinicella sp.]|jgi:hypothetical protein